MPPPFKLAGLLRLRGIQQDKAAGALAEAHREQKILKDRRRTAAEHLAGTDSTPQNAEALMAIVAARASARSMFLELDGVMEASRTRVEQARAEFAAAKSDTAALEKLAARHAREETARQLRAEQDALDEIASTRRSAPVAPEAA